MKVIFQDLSSLLLVSLVSFMAKVQSFPVENVTFGVGDVASFATIEKSKQERQALLQSSPSKETAAVVLGQMLRQFLEANFRRLSLELNTTQANIYQELTMLQGLQHDVKAIQGVVSQMAMIKGAIADIRFIKDIFADTQYIKESQHMLSKRNIDSLLQLIQLSYSSAFMIGDVHDRIAKKQNCFDLRDSGKNASGVYTIWPLGVSKPGVEVWCDMDVDGGGWTVIQRRGFGPYGTSRQINFNRTWEDYEKGFGNVSIDYWFGLDNIRGLTRQCPYELLINMTNWEGEERYALYSRFHVGSSMDFYRLHVESHSGTAGMDVYTDHDEDSFLYHHKKQFSTYDKDNDDNWGESNSNCAETYGGGWWFGDCLRSNLNGKYFQKDGFLRKDALSGIRWNSWTGMKESLRMTEMKIRPKCGFFSFS